MSRSYHVDGPVLIQVGTGSVTNNVAALETLGVSEDGVDVIPNLYLEPRYSDAGGPRVPADLQDMGQDARVRCRIFDYDQAILEKLWIKAMGNATFGTGGPPGELIGTAGRTCRVVLTSADVPYRFITAVIMGAQPFKMGTVQKRPEIEFYAWKYIPAGTNTSAGIKLFDNTAA